MRMWADFNEARGKVIWTSLRRDAGLLPEGEPRVGQHIELWDYEGNTCMATVTSVDDPIVYLKLDASTWRDA